MNYFALLGALLTGVLALASLCLIIGIGIGKGRWYDAFWGPVLNALSVACFGTAAVAFFNMAVSA
jgi:hypothetical protein